MPGLFTNGTLLSLKTKSFCNYFSLTLSEECHYTRRIKGQNAGQGKRNTPHIVLCAKCFLESSVSSCGINRGCLWGKEGGLGRLKRLLLFIFYPLWCLNF
jgi:hypothetical protein